MRVNRWPMTSTASSSDTLNTNFNVSGQDANKNGQNANNSNAKPSNPMSPDQIAYCCIILPDYPMTRVNAGVSLATK